MRGDSYPDQELLVGRVPEAVAVDICTWLSHMAFLQASSGYFLGGRKFQKKCPKPEDLFGVDNQDTVNL